MEDQAKDQAAIENKPAVNPTPVPKAEPAPVAAPVQDARLALIDSLEKDVIGLSQWPDHIRLEFQNIFASHRTRVRG